MRVLLTGSRAWENEAAIAGALDGLPRSAVLVHGACPTGADAIADRLWRARGGQVEPHPADWSKGKSAGPKRNQAMVDLGADVCLAFPLENSRGTRHCMAAAERAGIRVVSYEDMP